MSTNHADSEGQRCHLTSEDPAIVNPEFIEENKRANLVKVGHKNAPFTRSQRRKRRMEVYHLHFEKGFPATRIAQILNVDRKTVNSDLKLLYTEAMKDYNPRDMNLSHYLEKQLFRLETQRDRLGSYLTEAKSLETKVAVERLIADIDFKLFRAIARLNVDDREFYDEVIKKVNKVAESKNLNIRFTSLFELYEISKQSRKNLDQIRQEMKATN